MTVSVMMTVLDCGVLTTVSVTGRKMVSKLVVVRVRVRICVLVLISVVVKNFVSVIVSPGTANPAINPRMATRRSPAAIKAGFGPISAPYVRGED